MTGGFVAISGGEILQLKTVPAAALTYFNVTRFTEFAIGYFIGGLGIALLLSSVSFWLFGCKGFAPRRPRKRREYIRII